MKRLLATVLIASLGALGSALIPIVPAQAATKVLYLTFDDGPSHPEHTRAVLAALAKNDAKATFFMVGQEVKEHPKTFMRVVNAGHEIANHSYTHADLAKLSSSKIRSQLTRTQSALGQYKGKCMRPPYGSYNSRVTSVVKSLGMRKIMWDYSTSDWKRPGVNVIANRLIDHAGNGKVILFHDGGGDGDQTAKALEIALPKLRAKGYVFKVVPNCS